MKHVNKKVGLIAICQILTVPAIMVPVFMMQSLKSHIAKTNQETQKALTAQINQDTQKVLAAIAESRKVNIANATELFNSLYHVTEYIDELERKTMNRIDKAEKQLSEKIAENNVEIKKTWDLANQTLDLLDELSQFIDSWFVRREAYNDHIYNELLDLKEKQIENLKTEIHGDLENIEAWIRDVWYDVITTSPASELKELQDEVAKVKFAAANLWELNCLSNYEGLIKNTSISLELKSYLLDNCRNFIANAVE